MTMQHFSIGALKMLLEKYDKYANTRWDDLPSKRRNLNRKKTINMFLEEWLRKRQGRK